MRKFVISIALIAVSWPSISARGDLPCSPYRAISYYFMTGLSLGCDPYIMS